MPAQPPIEQAFFRQAADGAEVFFPWGLNRRGYRLRDPAQKAKALRVASLLIASTVGVATWAAYRLQPAVESGAGAGEALALLVAPGVALVLVLLLYGAWAARFVERLAESDLQISREERMRLAAEAAEPPKVVLAGIVFAGMSGLVIVLEPAAWWIGLAGVAVGLGLAAFGVTLARSKARPPL